MTSMNGSNPDDTTTIDERRYSRSILPNLTIRRLVAVRSDSSISKSVRLHHSFVFALYPLPTMRTIKMHASLKSFENFGGGLIDQISACVYQKLDLALNMKDAN